MSQPIPPSSESQYFHSFAPSTPALLKASPLLKGIDVRFRSLLKETWKLWIAFLVGGIIMSILSPVFLVTFPICIFTFFWFAYIRYDDEGNFKGS